MLRVSKLLVVSNNEGPKAPTFQAPPWPHQPEKPKPIPPAPDTRPKAPPISAKPKTPRDGARPENNPGAVVYKAGGGMIRVSKLLAQWMTVSEDQAEDFQTRKTDSPQHL